VNQLSKHKPSTNLALLLLCFSLPLIVRALLVFKAPLSNYGYDYGFYLFALKHTSFANFFSLFSSNYQHPLFFFAQIFKFDPALFLNFSYFGFSLFLGYAIYLFFGQNKTAALWSVVFFALSLVQQESYPMFLYKSAFALPLMFLAFKFLAEKNWPSWFIISVLIILSHKTTAVIYLLTVFAYFLFNFIKTKPLKLAGLVILPSALTILLFFSKIKLSIFSLFNPNSDVVQNGLFLPGINPLSLIWPVMLFALPGLYFYFKNKLHPLPIFFLAVSTFWILFSLPFYRRIYIYLDLSLIIFAGYFFSIFTTKISAHKNYKLFLSGIILSLVSLFVWQINFSLQKEPLISAAEVMEIKQFNQHPGFILALSANDAPWLLAYAGNYRLGAPGLLEDPQTFTDWQNFWHGLNQSEFLKRYPRPLYFYQRSWQILDFPPNCLKNISENFSVYTCN
jgi:hypothetical protein